MTVQIVASILLALRFASIFFIFLVLVRQFRLFKLHIDSGLVSFRIIMFALGIVFLLGSVVPIGVDYYYAVVHPNSGWNWLLVGYAVSNAITALVASVILWNIYRIAGAELDERQEEEDKLND